MDFKEATDTLFAGISHSDLAKRVGVSVATIRQARLSPDAKAHRAPPNSWEDGVIRVAEAQIRHYRRLIEDIRRTPDTRNDKPTE